MPRMVTSGTSPTQAMPLLPGESWRTTAELANFFVLVLAAVVLLGWGLQIPALTTLLRGTTPMFPVTTVAVLAGSIAVFLIKDRRGKWSSIAAGFLAIAVVLIGLVVLFEYLFGFNLGLDQTLFRHAMERQLLPGGGRIAPNTACDLVLLGTALLLFITGNEKATRIAQLLTVVAGLVAFFGLSGYIYGQPHLYTFSNFTAMSLPASVAFLLLCTSLLAFRAPPRPGFGISLGVVLLLAVVAVNAIASLLATKALLAKNSLVEHTRAVEDELDGTLTAVLNTETGERGYLYTGEREYLAPYQLGRLEIQVHLSRLADLTADNPSQRQNVALLRSAAQDATAFFAQAVELESAGQHEAAKQFVLTDGGKTKVEAVRAVLDEMKAEEKRLLAVRSQESQRSGRYLLLAIPISHALTGMLLVIAGLLVSRDMRKRVRTARQLRELAEGEHEARQLAEAAHQRTEGVLSAISDMFIVLDTHWRILYVNTQAIRLMGRPREALIGEDYWTVFPETAATQVGEAYRRTMESQNAEAFDAFDAALRKWFRLHLYPSPETLTIFAQDITETKQAQDALVRAEKLAAVGRMAATVAHEINNPLEAVTNLIWLARNEPSASESIREKLAVADEELRRVAHITKQTLAFYRDASAPAMVKVPEIMKGVLGLYARRLESKELSLRTQYEDCSVFGYAGELRQLFSNLFANAIDAVPTGGKLVVRISQWTDGKNASQPGIRITVADNGCGISPEHLSRLFEPFFTTKDSTGTGLGLWVAKQIAGKHGGRITVRSNASAVHHYTAVSVFLPIAIRQIANLAAAG